MISIITAILAINNTSLLHHCWLRIYPTTTNPMWCTTSIQYTANYK